MMIQKMIESIAPTVSLYRNERIGISGGWDIEVRWFWFRFLYRTTDQQLKLGEVLFDRIYKL